MGIEKIVVWSDTSNSKESQMKAIYRFNMIPIYTA